MSLSSLFTKHYISRSNPDPDYEELYEPPEPRPKRSAEVLLAEIEKNNADNNPRCHWFTLPPNHQYEWDRVQQMRRTHHPLVSGGRSTENRRLKIGYDYVHKAGKRRSYQSYTKEKFNSIWDKG